MERRETFGGGPSWKGLATASEGLFVMCVDDLLQALRQERARRHEGKEEEEDSLIHKAALQVERGFGGIVWG